jgi:lipopolysaccharide assembly outer membrane protein LptD (OstA)
MLRHVPVACALCLLAAGIVHGQQAPTSPPPAQGQSASLDETKLPDLCRSEEFNLGEKQVHYAGNVTCVLPDNARVDADVIDVYATSDGTRITGQGNVVFTGPDGHIDAERLEYNASTATGVFTVAHGFLALGPTTDRRQFAGQMPEVEFWGHQLEKLGPKRFRLTQGGWTTCLQPTPRWDFTTGSAVLELDHYVRARNTALRVKGVPLFWLPYMYYPIQHDNRATGFLLPTIGGSTFRGRAISNAFFWAIDRSQDMTFFYDYFSRAGQGAGTEYRYVASAQSSGTVRFYRFLRDTTTFTENGATSTLAGSNSYEITGNAIQTLRPGLIARVRLDYFSDIVDKQLLHQTLADSSNSNRFIEAGLTASHGPWSGNLLYQRNELINSQRNEATNSVDDTIVYGGVPRVNAILAPQRLFSSPIYASFNTDLGYLPYRHIVDGTVVQDNGFGRFDASPSVRIPFSKLSFLSINTSAAFRTTFYTRHADETTGAIEDGSYMRDYATVRADMVGPVFSRIFDLQDNPFAERLKHVIEPTVSIDFTTPIDDYKKTPVQSDVSDVVIGGTSRVTYGITSRLFYRKPTVNKVRGETREFFTVGLQQTAYSNSEASRYDSTYSSTVASPTGQELSPLTLTARISPTSTFDGNVRAEYDVSHGYGLQTLTTGASVNYAIGGLTLNYSRQRYNPAQQTSSFVSASARTQLVQNRVAATYSIDLDVARGYVARQGVIASYMAQCCGIQGEYQVSNYPPSLGLPVSTDRRINFAFVLAGLGTFSNVFGAFGGH